MTIALDGHIHIYPCHDWAVAIRALLTNLPAADCKLGLLTETPACDFFRTALAQPAAFRSGSLALEPGPEAGALAVLDAGVLAGFLIAGRQIVTAERLEVLALGMDAAVPDRLPAREALAAVRAQGAVPVLPWAPGKWFGARGRLVEQLILEAAPEALLVGDTTLRPALWPLPRLMKLAVGRGLRILPGSDPLPVPGEERIIGSYGGAGSAAFDAQRPVTSLRALLATRGIPFRPTGRRSTTRVFARRWLAHEWGKRKKREGGGS